MKNLILNVLILTLAFAEAYSQNIQGIATYQTQRHVDIKLDSTMGDDIQKTIQEQLRKQFQKEYKLNFNSNESLWKEDVSIDKPQAPSNNGVVIQVSGNQDVLYKDITQGVYTRASDLMGKKFLIEDKLEKPEWVLEKETKNIGQYTCFKATQTREVENTTSTNGGEIETKKETVVTTAWYTLDIPVKHGPDDFWGLPGLILEVNNGRMAMMCTQVVLNPKNGISMEIPEKGKKVNQETYEKIAEEKSKEMMERMNSNRRNGDSNSFSIRIGG